MELTFPQDHPEVPKMIDTIYKLHGILITDPQPEPDKDEDKFSPVDIVIQPQQRPTGLPISMTAGTAEGASMIQG